MAKAIQVWVLSKLKPYVNNARTHSPEQVDKIARSIEEFGFNAPILVDSNNGIIAGHGRYAAAQKLGLTEVPVIVLDHLTDAERRAYILADNRIAEMAGWDSDLLRAEFEGLQMEEFDLGLTGFDDLTIERFLAGGEEVDQPEGEWAGMPEYKHQDLESKHRVIVHFATEEDREAFSKLIGQKVGPKTRSIWYPEAEIGVTRDKHY